MSWYIIHSIVADVWFRLFRLKGVENSITNRAIYCLWKPPTTVFNASWCFGSFSFWLLFLVFLVVSFCCSFSWPALCLCDALFYVLCDVLIFYFVSVVCSPSCLLYFWCLVLNEISFHKKIKINEEVSTYLKCKSALICRGCINHIWNLLVAA